MQSSRAGLVAFAKQASVGTPAAAPTYAVPVIESGLAPTKETEQLSLTGPTLSRRGLYVVRAGGGGDIQILAHPAPIGLLMYEVMGAQAITGAGPFDHAFTFSDALPLPLTVWKNLGDYWWRFQDCYVGKLTIRGAAGENLVLVPEFVARSLPARVAAPAYTLEAEEPRFKYIGSETKLEADNATPVVVDNQEAFELVIDRVPLLRYGTSLGPNRIAWTARDVDYSATVIQDTDGANQGWDYLVAAYLGSVAATGFVAQGLARGSFAIKSGRHPNDAARYLQVVSNGAIWEYMVEDPQPDPAGEPIELEVAGPLKAPASGSEITINVLNEVAAVY